MLLAQLFCLLAFWMFNVVTYTYHIFLYGVPQQTKNTKPSPEGVPCLAGETLSSLSAMRPFKDKACENGS